VSSFYILKVANRAATVKWNSKYSIKQIDLKDAR